MRTRHLLILLLVFSAVVQSSGQTTELRNSLRKYFKNYVPKEQKLLPKPKFLRCDISSRTKTLKIYVEQNFSYQNFTPETVEDIYSSISGIIPKAYKSYKLQVITNGYAIDELVPNRFRSTPDSTRQWSNIKYTGAPWVKNISRPNKITKGLAGNHLALWASHGRFYDWNKDVWRWQRPKLFGTTEDLFTPTIVIPYLIPMLENAGAYIFTPRERDHQKSEIIIDNDSQNTNGQYRESGSNTSWQTTEQLGFAWHNGTYLDGENPFNAGTARMSRTTTKTESVSEVYYKPNFRKGGRYAVYVSYQTLQNSIDDAQYIVWHKGSKTEFKVNQQMGGSTWVYLGTFDFDQGCNDKNCVVLTNLSRKNGVVTTDAVRFGGGMGNIEREGSVSGLPRTLEAARYYAQWAGMPYDIYSSRNGVDDYSDDINTRSFMTNYLAGGSCYMPKAEGCKVPLELSLAIHSDAGFVKDSTGIIGSLTICTTKYNEGLLNSGISRLASRDLADALLSNVTSDIQRTYGIWNKRQIYDRNYSETRVPGVPSAILETMSHQNFPDMRYGQDPNFKFTFARSIYKTLLKYVSEQHGRPYTVTPLSPNNFRIEMNDNGLATLSWEPTIDELESTSTPTGYIIYTQQSGYGYDNGTLIKKACNYRLQLKPNVLYSFKVAAVNEGGQSFTTEELCALYNPKASKNILIINGFNRLSPPAIIDNDSLQGFDFDTDPGISLGSTAGWVGKQVCFDKSTMGIEDESGLGWSNDDYTGVFIAGNERNYVRTHAEAISTAGRYSIVSCSSNSVETGKVQLTQYNMVDLVLGLECNDGRSLKPYKTFTPAMQRHLRNYTSNQGALLVSGAHVASDMTSPSDSIFIADVLKCSFAGDNHSASNEVNGMGTRLTFIRDLNETHYAAISPDNLQPLSTGFAALRYSDGHDACIGNKTEYRSFTIGFPFECIEGKEKQGIIMRGILQFLME